MKKQSGFTLVEVLLVMGLFAVLAAFTTVNLLRPQIKSSVDRTLNTLVADIKQQQLKAMIGDDDGTTLAQTYGIYFDTNSYTLFRGTTYNASDPSNFTISLQGTTLTNINLPSSQLVFSRVSGEVTGYSTGSDNLTISHEGGLTTTLTLNRYGAITIN